MGASHNFTYGKFTITILSVMSAFALLFVFIMILAYLYLDTEIDKKTDFNLSFAVPVCLYLSFIAGWAIAYTKYFQFPKNQRVLLVGMAVAALVMPVFVGTERLSTGQMNFSELLSFTPGYLFGGLLGAAIQLYLLVIVLRFVVRFKWPF